MSSDSEGSCTSPTPSSSSSGSVKSPSCTKRCNKPLMERKRRERINCSLNVLKQLVLDALKKDTSQYSKLEKADILEMTVKHLRDLQRGQLVKAASSDASVVGKYRAGFTECASEVTRYLGSVDGVKPEVRDRLVNHLNGCVQRVHSVPATHIDRHPHPNHHHQHQQQSMPQHHLHHQAQIQSASPQSSAYYTATSDAQRTLATVLPVSVSATRPIQIQIPVATSAASLPGAPGVHALQVAAIPTSACPDGASAATSGSGSGATGVAYLPPRVAASSPPSSPSQQMGVGGAVYGGTSVAPPTGASYMAAFHVVPSAQAPAFVLPQGQLATPIYAVSASPAQQAQLQTLILSQMAAASASASATPLTPAPAAARGTPSPPPPPPPQTVAPPTARSVPAAVPIVIAPLVAGTVKRRATEDSCQHSGRSVKKMMTSYNPMVVTSYNAKIAINEAMRDEKVWRPW